MINMGGLAAGLRSALRTLKLKNDDDDEGQEEENKYNEDELTRNDASPFVANMYELLFEPESSNIAMGWNLTLSLLVALRIIEIAVESTNGPNQYAHRAINRAQYSFLFTDSQYFTIYVLLFVPLIVDGLLRVYIVYLVLRHSENAAFKRIFRDSWTEKFMFIADVIGLIPFFVFACYLRPNNIYQNQGNRIMMRLVELLTTARIFRCVRFAPPIAAISTALSNSFHALILPVFFFFIFNISSAVLFYFAEPCYHADSCPWDNLFQSTFFSIVTMTTSKFDR
jgi:hypothetical protein